MSLQNINWYPGHMKKTRELIASNLKLVDIVIEVIDARIPVSSRNPVIDELTAGKQRIIILNKSDLSDGQENKRWIEKLSKDGSKVMTLDSKNLRLMIVGVPNVGKSSLINRLTGKKSAKTGDKPGVTKGKQWLTLSNGMQLLDTPGILWPKFEDENVGIKLAFCGSIKDEILDLETLALRLIELLQEEYPKLLANRYKLEEISDEGLVNMDNIALNRGFILSKGRIDYSRCAKTVLDEFRSAQIGRITLERAK